MNIGIAGVGGIGSNVALNLVRSGIDRLTLVDFDRVEPSNLNRQFYFADQVGRLKVEALAENLRRIRTGLRLVTRAERIDPHNCRVLFADCELIVEGLDRIGDKKMLLMINGTCSCNMHEGLKPSGPITNLFLHFSLSIFRRRSFIVFQNS